MGVVVQKERKESKTSARELADVFEKKNKTSVYRICLEGPTFILAERDLEFSFAQFQDGRLM